MHRVCLLTDSSAQFPNHAFSGQDQVRVIPFDIEVQGVLYPDGNNLKSTDFPATAGYFRGPKLVPPNEERFEQLYQTLFKEFDDILVLVQSEHLSKMYDVAARTATHFTSGRNIVIINSQTTSVGLGILVQLAADTLQQGGSFSDVEHIIRKQVPHIYTVFCTSGHSYLYHAGIIDKAQAVVAEMQNFITVFSLEEERLTPLEKVRNYRNTIEFFSEFLEEFDNLFHIALIQSTPPLIAETRAIRQLFLENYPDTSYTEHNLNPSLAVLFGPRLLGLVAAERI